MPEALALTLAILAFGGGLLLMRAWHQRKLDETRIWYRLRFPRDLSAEAVAAFLQGLSGVLPMSSHGLFGLPAVVLEVSATDEGISHWLGVPEHSSPYVLGQVRAAIPSIRVTETERREMRPTSGSELKLSRGHVPLRTARASAVAASLLATLQPLKPGEKVWLQWVVTPSSMRRKTESALSGDDITEVIAGRQSAPKLSRDERAKLSEPLFLAVGRIGVQTVRGSGELMHRIIAGIKATRDLEARLESRRLPDRFVAKRLVKASVPLISFPALLNSAELSALAALPMESPVLPGLVLGGARELPATPAIETSGLQLGLATYPGAEQPIALCPADARRHLLILGPTGAGKSALLNNLAVERMRAGDGLLVVDPAGDLAARPIDSVPKGRERDVIVIDPADTEFPVGINLLRTPDRSAELIVDDFVAVVKRAWGESLVGPRSEDILRMACSTLTTQPDAVLTDLPRLLIDKGFRRRIVGALDDPIALQPFWAWFDSLTVVKRADVVGPISNKLRQFYRPMLRNIIGQVESSFSMSRAMQEKKIIICSLARGAMGEGAASFFGAMLMALWAQAVQARVNIAPGERESFYAFVDEFQTLLGFSAPLDEILAQARKYGCSLTIATQSLSTLPKELRDAVVINSRSKVVFQTGAADGRAMAREFAPHLNVDDLRGLEAFQAYAVVSTGSMSAPPVSIRTLPPPPTTSSGKKVRALSRQQYGRPRAEVEAAIRARHEDKGLSTPVGRRAR